MNLKNDYLPVYQRIFLYKYGIYYTIVKLIGCLSSIYREINNYLKYANKSGGCELPKGIKLLVLIISIVIINVILLSPGLLGITLSGGGAFQTAAATAILTASVLVLLYGIYQSYFQPPVITPLKELKSPEEYITALSPYKNIQSLKKEITFSLEQIQRINKKKDALWNVLNQRFEPNEISYKKFTTVIIQVEQLFYLNLSNIINKIRVFDEKEYIQVIEGDSSRFSERILMEKTELYNEFAAFINNALNLNEEILLDLDKLLLEITKLNSFEIDDINNMPCMKEMEHLIIHAKLYKH